MAVEEGEALLSTAEEEAEPVVCWKPRLRFRLSRMQSLWETAVPEERPAQVPMEGIQLRLVLLPMVVAEEGTTTVLVKWEAPEGEQGEMKDIKSAVRRALLGKVTAVVGQVESVGPPQEEAVVLASPDITVDQIVARGQTLTAMEELVLRARYLEPPNTMAVAVREHGKREVLNPSGVLVAAEALAGREMVAEMVSMVPEEGAPEVSLPTEDQVEQE